MKSAFIITLLFAGLSAVAQADQKFTIKGELKKFANPVEKIFLTYRSNGSRISDSVLVKNGRYAFTGLLSEAVLATLRVKYAGDKNGQPIATVSKRDIVSVFLSPATMEADAKDSLVNIKVKGSPAHTAYLKLEDMLKPSTDKMAALSNEWMQFGKQKDLESQKKLEPKFDVVGEEIKAGYGAFVKANPNSPIALYAINQFAGYDIDADKVEPVFNLLSAKAKATISGKDLADRIAISKKTGIGKMAMDFTQNDTLGKPVSLSSFRGKVMLVDFWASWCGPCRRENPNVVKAYHKYKDKGFDILGVSLDQPEGKARWIKAIHDDSLTWTHVSDLQFWDNAVAKQYGIRAIPFNLLIDATGKILGRSLTGEALDKKLAEVLQ